eukprot:GFUD01029411.1.p1 GENE.GFUD01029411.1~~GFUD01029411.1.p1  ORF type:complete len:392 (+),score=163.05 GFUD01029411.1:54-1229(+)
MSSWAEQYEARKAARLSEEKLKLNRNLGFGVSDSIAGNGGQVSCSVEEGANKSEKGTEELKVAIDPVEPNTDHSTIQKDKEEKENKDVNLMKDDMKMKEKVIDKCSKTEDPVSPDPWFSTYEAKKAKALENLKSGKLQSVAGASGFVGKVEGVEHLSKQNEVTRLMNRFKKEEPKPETVSNMTKVDIRIATGDTNKTVTKQVTGKVETVQTDTNMETKTVSGQDYKTCQPSSVSCGTTTTITVASSTISSAYSSKPPPPPRQLVQQAMQGTWPEEPSSPPSDRPSRPTVPTPSKYGTLYGGAPSPGPNPSRFFQPPGFVPPTPPGSLARTPARPGSLAQAVTDTKQQTRGEKDKKDSFQSLVRSVKEDSKLSTSSWQEEYEARKKARFENT